MSGFLSGCDLDVLEHLGCVQDGLHRFGSDERFAQAQRLEDLGCVEDNFGCQSVLILGGRWTIEETQSFAQSEAALPLKWRVAQF